MKLNRNAIVNVGYAMSLALAGITGCATDGSTPKDFFPADDDSRRSRVFMNAETTSGARENLTLNDVHFDGGKLNSLGSEKLARIVPDTTDGNVNVYLDVTKNDMAAARHEDVMVYLKATGIADSRIKLHDGGNTALTSPTADGIARLPKVETGDLSGGSQSGSGDTTASSGGSSGSSMAH